MSTKMIKISTVLAVVIVMALGFMTFFPLETVLASSPDRRGGPGNGGGNGKGGNTTPGTPAAVPSTSLSDAEKEVLSKAILEEYGAYNLYQSVITKFGNVAPFSWVVNSEQQHINALTRQAVKYGVTVPVNPGLATTPSFTTVQDACEASVDAEKADAALYDQLKPSVTHTDILQVFNNLQSASLNNHLPAFQVCQ